MELEISWSDVYKNTNFVYFTLKNKNKVFELLKSSTHRHNIYNTLYGIINHQFIVEQINKRIVETSRVYEKFINIQNAVLSFSVI